MIRGYFSGIFFIVFSAIALGIMAMFARAAYFETGAGTPEEILHGKWTSQFEKKFNEIIPVFEPSRLLWGRAEYALFREGRRGVLIGSDGWLFTDEEFACPLHAEKNLEENLAYIRQVRDELTQKNVQLAVIVVPAKSRVYPEHLGRLVVPPCHTGLYEQANNFLSTLNVRHADLLPAMQKAANREELYLRTDTHWSDKGALFAARSAAQLLKDFSFDKKIFMTQAKGEQEHKGDLLRYVPGVASIAPDRIPVLSTEEKDAGGNLFDAAVPGVTLVGTSYSANPLWNFEGYLKQSLQTDVLNMADEGLGPFTVMDKYLKNDAWRNNPPQLVIWEIPERYLVMPHDIKNNKKTESSEKLF